MISLFSALWELMEVGGFAMPPLVGCAALLWYTLGIRMQALRRGSRLPVRSLVQAYQAGRGPTPHGLVDHCAQVGVQAVQRRGGQAHRAVLEELFGPARAAMEQGRITIRSVVAISPLLGLLGTVNGMIETFKSLADMALFTQGGGIAGGIAEALLTTQMGLVVSVPGILMGRLLERKQARLEGDLDQLEELLIVGLPTSRAEEAA